MTEEDARGWIAQRFGASGTAAMEQIADIVSRETARQNLVAPSTLATMWSRHIVDSAQLLPLVFDASDRNGPWIDIGSGAGFPGLVIAALGQQEVWLVEPRSRRAAFLREAAGILGLHERVTVVADRIEAVSGITAAVISARAVAPLTKLLDWAKHCSGTNTQWVVPKGRTALEDVATARKTWHGVFHVEHSVTDPDSLIVLASGVARR